MAVRAKHFEYAIAIDREGRVAAEGRTPAELSEDWKPEHLLLAALARCSMESLDYFARRSNVEVAAEATASGMVTRREDEDRFGFVDFTCRVEVEMAPVPPDDQLRSLLASAEWGCFVGASLRPAPAYRWRVNGREVRS